MSRRPLIVVLALCGAGLLAYGVTRALVAPPPVAPEMAEQLAWLAREFRLTPGQAVEISRLQAAYAPLCAAHCDAVVAARQRFEHAADPAERTAAETDLARLEQVCAEATRAHLRNIAAVLPANQAERFLATMEPHLTRASPHTGAPALDGSP